VNGEAYTNANMRDVTAGQMLRSRAAASTGRLGLSPVDSRNNIQFT
jgi:hypothetical protein